MKMSCKYCDHEKNGNKLLLGVDKEMTNSPVSHQFLCVPVALKHQVEDFPIPMKETFSKALVLVKWGQNLLKADMELAQGASQVPFDLHCP